MAGSEKQSSKMKWVEITSKFKNSLESLQDTLNAGEIITLRDEDQLPCVSNPRDGSTISRTLQEAMSAIEMMEKKMDAGSVLQTHQAEDEIVRDFDHALELGLARSDGQEDQDQVRTVFDRLGNGLARYLEGDSFQSTVGACVYELLNLGDRPKIEASLTFNLCYSFRIICSLASDVVNTAQIQEEEDFEMHQIFSTEINLEEHTDRMTQFSNLNVTDEYGVSHRLKLINHLQDFVQLMHAYLVSKRVLDNDFLGFLKKYAVNIKALAQTIQKDFMGYEDVTLQKKTREFTFGFDQLMSYSRVQSGYPKAPVKTSRDYFYTWLQNMCDDVLHVVNLATCQKLYSVNELGWNFTRRHPSLIPRAIAALILSIKLTISPDYSLLDNSNNSPLYGELPADQVSVALKRIGLDDIFLFSNKAKVFADKKFGGDLFAQWFSPTCIVIDRLLPAICETPSRQYFTYLYGIRRLYELQEQASIADGELAKHNKSPRKKKSKDSPCYPFTKCLQTYTKFLRYTTAEKHILLGFELELYTRKEFEMVTYIMTYILELKIGALEEILPTFIITKQTDRDQYQYKQYLETIFLRSQTMLNYMYGLFIACKQQACEQMSKMSLATERTIFVKRFGTFCESMGLEALELYDGYKAFKIDTSPKSLLDHFNQAQNFCSQLGSTSLIWSMGSITRKSSSDLPVKIAGDKMAQLIKVNVIASKLLVMAQLPAVTKPFNKKLVIRVDSEASLPVLKLV